MSNATPLSPLSESLSPAARPGGDDALAQIVRLFQPNRDRGNGENWAATLSLIQGVAKQVRDIHQNAHVAVDEANRSLRDARAAALAANERADQAEGEADLARRRADHAEVQVRDLAQELAQAEKRIEEAEHRIAELSLWLRRVHDCMEDEFNNLTIAPLHAPRS